MLDPRLVLTLAGILLLLTGLTSGRARPTLDVQPGDDVDQPGAPPEA